jgi:hypothetical protein
MGDVMSGMMIEIVSDEKPRLQSRLGRYMVKKVP